MIGSGWVGLDGDRKCPLIFLFWDIILKHFLHDRHLPLTLVRLLIILRHNKYESSSSWWLSGLYLKGSLVAPAKYPTDPERHAQQTRRTPRRMPHSFRLTSFIRAVRERSHATCFFRNQICENTYVQGIILGLLNDKIRSNKCIPTGKFVWDAERHLTNNVAK